ncbi:class II fructose-bisphosphate aldolase [Eubacterium callanderi]|uniref:class II fructose-bisphosphate aldolase n=1 Tax=Eubacterium callanderi TaxID=53442 RepID=UPI001D083949|nr:class II fructose-bisphosphate aldolase [Eubacterium callanderi]MCB6660559.1 class II fructose-bisphosphate aldolase [Eubacterium callanderi]MCB6753408.1 class II fructose-bisphosphate aldolase [Eubacterium callanderi]MCB7105288.1 class II fructose-bisphosphate aldolase [Eubacterium callanderi]MCG4820637.1 class II fructose-bisphosphate aldolase [Eubacterium callanderi]MCQ5190511.1 class II fructose-bisphosphate aldolase [Eubacterium callanderi]
MLVTLNEIMKDAYAKKYAVGAFNTVNLASIRAVLDAAEKLDAPVILQHAQIHESVAPLKVIGPVMLEMARAAQVPVCVHLDHGEDIDYLLSAMEMGFTSVMFDGSALPYDENVAGTRAVVQAAANYNVSVEAELGRVLRPEGGGEPSEEEADLTPEDCYTKPGEALAFVEATGIDALAIAFGTAHGVYEAEPKLDFNRIAEIRRAVNMPLVMHGGSGVGDVDFREAIKNGVTKVNYLTYMSLAGGDAVKAFLKENAARAEIRYDELAEAARIAMQAHVEHAIGIFTKQA